MKLILKSLGAIAAVLQCGCISSRIVASGKVPDRGEYIETKYKYRVVSELHDVVNSEQTSIYNMRSADFEMFQPDVFDANGIPISVEKGGVRDKGEYGGDWTLALFFGSCGILPAYQGGHVHTTITISLVGKRRTPIDVEVCIKGGEAFAYTPLSYLFNAGFSTCQTGARVFSGRVRAGYREYANPIMQSIAYSVAAKLKELEDRGFVNDTTAARGRATQSLSEIKETQNNQFQIVTLECESGRDFAYRFKLRPKSGGKVSPKAYNAMRTAFRSSIRSQYAAAHKVSNPRALVVDFPEYSLKDGCITGRALVLTIDIESMSYDASRRRGKIVVRIGANQFEDVRRWIRRNIGELARGSNISIQGNKLPTEGVFYSESETLGNDGCLTVEFRTE